MVEVIAIVLVLVGTVMYWLDGDVYGSGGYHPMPTVENNALADEYGACLQCGQPENHPICCLTNAKPGAIVPISDPKGLLATWSGPVQTFHFEPKVQEIVKPKKKKIEPLKTYTGRKFREG